MNKNEISSNVDAYSLGEHVIIDTAYMNFPFNGREAVIYATVFDPMDNLLYILEIKKEDREIDHISYIALYKDQFSLLSANPDRKLSAQGNMDNADTIPVRPYEFDLSKYLPDEKMQEIAQKVFADRISSSVDNAIKKRSEACHKSLTDMIFDQIVKDYIKQLTPKFEESLLKMISIEINDNWKEESEYGDSLYQTTLYGLQDCIRKYMNEHHDEISSMVSDKISDIVKSIGEYNLRKMITDKININEILRSVFNELKEIK